MRGSDSLTPISTGFACSSPGDTASAEMSGSPRFPGDPLPTRPARTTPPVRLRLAMTPSVGVACRFKPDRRHRDSVVLRGSIAQPAGSLSTLRRARYRAPRKTRFQPAGSALAGWGSNPQGHFQRFQCFQAITSSSARLSWRTADTTTGCSWRSLIATPDRAPRLIGFAAVG